MCHSQWMQCVTSLALRTSVYPVASVLHIMPLLLLLALLRSSFCYCCFQVSQP